MTLQDLCNKKLLGRIKKKFIQFQRQATKYCILLKRQAILALKQALIKMVTIVDFGAFLGR